MSLTPDQPMSRRAVRAARQATGEQPSVETTAPDVEDTGTTTSQPILGPDGQPLTRRRLRELRETGLIPAVTPESTPIAPPPGEAAAPVEASAPPASAGTRQGAQYFRPVITPATPVADAPTASPARATQPDSPVTPAPASEPVAAPSASPSAFAPRAEPAAPVPAWTAPEGHWTRQLELEDDVEITASREVGGASTTASMLVVDELPKVVDLGGPLGETGEVLLTGSIALRPDFAATGAISGMHGDPDADDAFGGGAGGGSAAPIRASAIASQHALGTPIVAGGKPRGSRAINVLIVTASVLAVLVTGLVVTAIVLRWI